MNIRRALEHLLGLQKDCSQGQDRAGCLLKDENAAIDALHNFFDEAKPCLCGAALADHNVLEGICIAGDCPGYRAKSKDKVTILLQHLTK